MNIYRIGQVFFGILFVGSVILILIWMFGFGGEQGESAAIIETQIAVTLDSNNAVVSTLTALETVAARPSSTPIPSFTPTRPTTIIITPTAVDGYPNAPDPNSGDYVYLTIVAGDTLYSIARRYGITVSELASANGLSNANIYAGQVLIVPIDDSGFDPTPTIPFPMSVTPIPEEVALLSTRVQGLSNENGNLKNEIATLKQNQMVLIDEKEAIEREIIELVLLVTVEAMAREFNNPVVLAAASSENGNDGGWFNQENINLFTTTFIGLVGLLSTTALKWREELRKDKFANSELEREKARLNNNILEIEAEQKRLELEKSRQISDSSRHE